jgi:SpoVK/Ycf46/Vps4 family AAA+-type ATPase
MFIKVKQAYRMVSGDPKNIVPELKPAVYKVSLVVEGMDKFVQFEETKRYKSTKIIDAGVFKKIDTYIDNFLADEMFEARKILGMYNKLGLMFTGTPGSGKTMLAGQIAQKFVDKKQAIAIMTNTFWEFDLPKLVDAVREQNPNSFVVVIMDEFEKCKEYKLQDGELLSYLDGNTSRDNVLNLALVNSTSSMKDFLLKRQGRFEQVYNFDEENDSVLKAFINCMTPKAFIGRLDTDYIARQLISEKRRTVDSISIAIRDSIAEILYFDKYGAFKTFNSFAISGVSDKKVGFETPINFATEDSDLCECAVEKCCAN